MTILRSVFLVCLTLFMCTTVAVAQLPLREDSSSDAIFARKSAGQWQATALYFDPRRYKFAARYECIVRAEGAAVFMLRTAEALEMPIRWEFLAEEYGPDKTSLTPLYLETGGQTYELGKRPWRLAEPNADGITVSVETLLPVFRKAESDPWLPVSLLTNEMLSARRLIIGYSFEEIVGETATGDSIWKTISMRKPVSLSGFRETTKWCNDRIVQDKLDTREKIQASLTDDEGNPLPTPETPPIYLILDFPDGSRGGKGRIVGKGSTPEQNKLEFLETIEACGARELFTDHGWSHHFYILIPSSRRDRGIVECLAETTDYHFTAGLGLRQPGQFPVLDRTLFLNLEIQDTEE